MQDLEQLKYPIGKYNPPSIITFSQIEDWIADLAQFPTNLVEITRGLEAEDLEVAYRPGAGQ